MPFPFVLPTTSNFSFSSAFTSDSHPSLPLTASTYRGVLRDHLKKHKRLPPTSQSANIPTIVASITAYLPYLLTLEAGLRNTNGWQDAHGEVKVTPQNPPSIEWRPTLSDSGIPGREPQRVKIQDLRQEVAFVLLTLGAAETLLSRAALHPLYVTSTAGVDTQQRTTAVQTATRNLLDAASIYAHAASLAENATASPTTPPPCADLSPSTIRALSSLALAEATLLAVLKDDPYPAIVAQDRNANDREWMYKSPDIKKVRAHLFARLCLAAGEHAAHASSLLQSCAGVDPDLARYVENLRRTSRAKACRFLGIDADIGGKVGEAIAWLDAGLQELGVEKRDDGKKRSFGLGKMRKEWSEKREDKKVERETDWGGDAGKLEETRVIEMLSEKWNKVNDTVNTQVVPPIGPLLARMPTGREMHQLPIFRPPSLESGVLDAMRAPPDRTDSYGDVPSSDEDGSPSRPVAGAFPESGDYSRSGSTGYY